MECASQLLSWSCFEFKPWVPVCLLCASCFSMGGSVASACMENASTTTTAKVSIHHGPAILFFETIEEDGYVNKVPYAEGNLVSTQPMVDHLLLKGAREGDMRLLQTALLRSANVNVRAENAANLGLTALMYAALEGHHAVCRLLLDAQASVHMVEVDGLTPLHFAAQSGHFDVCDLLVECHADVHATDDQHRKPLHYVRFDDYTQGENHRWRDLFDQQIL